MVSRGTSLRQERADGIALVQQFLEHADAIFAVALARLVPQHAMLIAPWSGSC